MIMCPSCGDCRLTAERIPERKNVFRCIICGHVFRYEPLLRLEKKYGEGTWNAYGNKYDKEEQEND